MSTELLKARETPAVSSTRQRKPRRANRLVFRPATAADARKLFMLIEAHVAEGQLLPRSLDELTTRAARFTVAANGNRIVGCAELAPLSGHVAEVRSLVVDATARGLGIGRALVEELVRLGTREGFATVCAFTHDPRFFVRLGFSMVPHAWVPEKIAHDCVGCQRFRSCGQSAVIRALGEGRRVAAGAFVPLASLRS